MHARTFYVRRAARIVPCLVALVAILSVLHWTGLPDYAIQGKQMLGGKQSLGQAVSSAFGLYLNVYEARTGYLPANWDVLWSLSIEEMFYLAFPVVCLLLRKDKVLAPLLALAAASLPFWLAAIHHDPLWQEKCTESGMAAIAMGVLAAIVAAHLKPGGRWVRIALETFGACGVVAVLGFEDQLWPWMRFSVLLLLTFSAACLVVGFHLHLRENAGWRLPATGWLQSPGRLSYEIYLTHMFVILSVVRLFHWMKAPLWWGILWYAPAFVLAWALGWLVARYYSTPCDKALRRKLIAAPEKPAAAV